MNTRGTFLFATLPGVALATIVAPSTSAQAAKLDEADRAAVALGYKHDAAKVDKGKFPACVVGRNCANCQLFATKTNVEWAPCAAVGNKLVNAKGWCVAWIKKA
jgi:hypothetical protein